MSTAESPENFRIFLGYQVLNRVAMCQSGHIKGEQRRQRHEWPHVVFGLRHFRAATRIRHAHRDVVARALLPPRPP